MPQGPFPAEGAIPGSTSLRRSPKQVPPQTHTHTRYVFCRVCFVCLRLQLRAHDAFADMCMFHHEARVGKCTTLQLSQAKMFEPRLCPIGPSLGYPGPWPWSTNLGGHPLKHQSLQSHLMKWSSPSRDTDTPCLMSWPEVHRAGIFGDGSDFDEKRCH